MPTRTEMVLRDVAIGFQEDNASLHWVLDFGTFSEGTWCAEHQSSPYVDKNDPSKFASSA